MSSSVWEIVRPGWDGDADTDGEPVRSFFDEGRLRELAGELSAYEAGRRDLTAVDLAALLEMCTGTLLMHTLLRYGERNRLRCGLQQTYGDHNRVLVYALDQIGRGDGGWFRSRAWRTDRPSQRGIEEVIAELSSLRLDRGEQLVLWLAASLHDYGKLQRRGYGLDAEDGVNLIGPILDVLCPATSRPLAEFVVRNHDLIEGVFSGETPGQFIGRQLEELRSRTRELALPYLGLIQFGGAASLGDGRLTARKTRIALRCLRGDALSGGSRDQRLALLLLGERAGSERRGPRRAARALQALGGSATEDLMAFLDSVVVPGWQAMWPAAEEPEIALGKRAVVLVDAAAIWARSIHRSEHVVFSDDSTSRVASFAVSSADTSWEGFGHATNTIRLLNHATALVL
jgi:hypothetical protein